MKHPGGLVGGQLGGDDPRLTSHAACALAHFLGQLEVLRAQNPGLLPGHGARPVVHVVELPCLFVLELLPLITNHALDISPRHLSPPGVLHQRRGLFLGVHSPNTVLQVFYGLADFVEAHGGRSDGRETSLGGVFDVFQA